MHVSKLYKMIVTLGPIGYLTAPGTLATLVTLPLVYAMQFLMPQEIVYLFFIFVLYGISIFLINRSLSFFQKHKDPSQIVIDEVVGCLLTFTGIPFTTPSVIVGFLLFRFFDILKIGGIKRTERYVGAWGIMLDDIVAALFSNILLRLLFTHSH